MDWYYAVGSERKGPVSEAELRERAMKGQLSPTDLVWNETMGDQWAEASTVPGLFKAFAAAPAPAAPPVPAAAPASGPAPEPEPSGPRVISCVTPVDRAWNRMVAMLFKPFEIGKWFALGFTAWLARLTAPQHAPENNTPDAVTGAYRLETVGTWSVVRESQALLEMLSEPSNAPNLELACHV